MADDGAQGDDVRGRLRDALIGIMIDKVREDRFPSHDMIKRLVEIV